MRARHSAVDAQRQAVLYAIAHLEQRILLATYIDYSEGYAMPEGQISEFVIGFAHDERGPEPVQELYVDWSDGSATEYYDADDFDGNYLTLHHVFRDGFDQNNIQQYEVELDYIDLAMFPPAHPSAAGGAPMLPPRRHCR